MPILTTLALTLTKNLFFVFQSFHCLLVKPLIVFRAHNFHIFCKTYFGRPIFMHGNSRNMIDDTHNQSQEDQTQSTPFYHLLKDLNIYLKILLNIIHLGIYCNIRVYLLLTQWILLAELFHSPLFSCIYLQNLRNLHTKNNSRTYRI